MLTWQFFLGHIAQLYIEGNKNQTQGCRCNKKNNVIFNPQCSRVKTQNTNGPIIVLDGCVCLFAPEQMRTFGTIWWSCIHFMAEKKKKMMMKKRRKRKNQYKHTSVTELLNTGHSFSTGFSHSIDADIVSARIQKHRMMIYRSSFAGFKPTRYQSSTYLQTITLTKHTISV